MILTMEHISAAACPECGCTEVLKFEKSNRHCNGQWNERLTFGCGLSLWYSPNFGRVESDEDCTKSIKARAWKARRAELAGLMIEALAKDAGVSPESLTMLQRSLASDLDLYRDDFEKVQP